MAEESDLEKTEPASSRRLEQAREEGQVPRSKEVGAFLILLVAASAFWFTGPWMLQRLTTMMRHGFLFGAEQLKNPQLITTRLTESALESLLSLAPLMLALIVAALAAPFFLGSWNFSLKALNLDLGRLDPIKGLSRVISWNGLAELVKAVAKASLVGGVAIGVLWNQRADIFALFGQPIEMGLPSAGHRINYSFLMIVMAMLLIVAIDVPFQLWQYHNKLKMSKDEVRREGKEMEGNPEVKGRIRQLQREAARKRMMSAVPTADVIVTNPTHFSVALAYKSGMGAPKVLAKGTGEIALKIREIGAKHSVPTLEAPPLARALYRHAEIDEEIPGPLYAAVAEVLAYVYQLSQWQKTGGDYPVPPREILVPMDLQVEAVNG